MCEYTLTLWLSLPTVGTFLSFVSLQWSVVSVCMGSQMIEVFPWTNCAFIKLMPAFVTSILFLDKSLNFWSHNMSRHKCANKLKKRERWKDWALPKQHNKIKCKTVNRETMKWKQGFRLLNRDNRERERWWDSGGEVGRAQDAGSGSSSWRSCEN